MVPVCKSLFLGNSARDRILTSVVENGAKRTVPNVK